MSRLCGIRKEIMRLKLFLLLPLILACGIQSAATTPAAIPSPSSTRAENIAIAASETPDGSAYVVCGAKAVHLRADAGIEHPVIGWLFDGDRIDIKGSKKSSDGGIWFSVRSGWMNSKFACRIVKSPLERPTDHIARIPIQHGTTPDWSNPLTTI